MLRKDAVRRPAKDEPYRRSPLTELRPLEPRQFCEHHCYGTTGKKGRIPPMHPARPWFSFPRLRSQRYLRIRVPHPTSQRLKGPGKDEFYNNTRNISGMRTAMLKHIHNTTPAMPPTMHLRADLSVHSSARHAARTVCHYRCSGLLWP